MVGDLAQELPRLPRSHQHGRRRRSRGSSSSYHHLSCEGRDHVKKEFYGTSPSRSRLARTCTTYKKPPRALAPPPSPAPSPPAGGDSVPRETRNSSAVRALRWRAHSAHSPVLASPERDAACAAGTIHAGRHPRPHRRHSRAAPRPQPEFELTAGGIAAVRLSRSGASAGVTGRCLNGSLCSCRSHPDAVRPSDSGAGPEQLLRRGCACRGVAEPLCWRRSGVCGGGRCGAVSGGGGQGHGGG